MGIRLSAFLRSRDGWRRPKRGEERRQQYTKGSKVHVLKKAKQPNTAASSTASQGIRAHGRLRASCCILLPVLSISSFCAARRGL